MIVILLPSTLRILPCRLISSPSHTSTLSPGWKLCSRSFPKGDNRESQGTTTHGKQQYARRGTCVPVLSVTTSRSMPSGWSSNFSSSDKVGFTPSVICQEQSWWWPQHPISSPELAYSSKLCQTTSAPRQQPSLPQNRGALASPHPLFPPLTQRLGLDTRRKAVFRERRWV